VPPCGETWTSTRNGATWSQAEPAAQVIYVEPDIYVEGHETDARPEPPAPAGVVDPMQWWGALTKQFTQLTASAMKDGAGDAAKTLAGTMVKQSFDAAEQTLKKAVSAPAKAAGAVAKAAGGGGGGDSRKRHTKKSR